MRGHDGIDRVEIAEIGQRDIDLDGII